MESGMRKSLGKGLEALLTAPTPAAAASELTVPIHQIVPNPEQPRRHFDDEALSLLADSIRRHGLLQPLVARRIAGRYELIAGERRLRAALRAGLERVPVIVREARAEDRLELALIENVQRENLTPPEEAEAYRPLSDERGPTQAERAARRNRQGKHPAAGRPAGDLHLRGLAEELTRGLGTRVRITRHPRGGAIEIEFYSDAELGRLIDRLRQAVPRA